MRVALILEIEELLFETPAVRASALHDALRQEGASIALDVVSLAHRGVPAAMALERLAPQLDLDATGRDLVLHRAAEHASRVFAVDAPQFDAGVRDALEQIRADVAIGVVTRATGADAMAWLTAAGLDGLVSTVRSLGALDPSEYVGCWADALRRTHASHGVALAAAPLLRLARRAGLRTIRIGPDPDASDAGYHPDAQLESLSQITPALLATLVSSSVRDSDPA